MHLGGSPDLPRARHPVTRLVVGQVRRLAPMDLGLQGKVAVVTGASRSIGLAVTKMLVDEGARVVAWARGPSTASPGCPA